jgi:hypothetical protein
MSQRFHLAVSLSELVHGSPQDIRPGTPSVNAFIQQHVTKVYRRYHVKSKLARSFMLNNVLPTMDAASWSVPLLRRLTKTFTTVRTTGIPLVYPMDSCGISLYCRHSQPIAPHQRPNAAVYVNEDGEGYYKGYYPVDVVCVITIRYKEAGSEEEHVVDKAFVQYYNYVFGKDQQEHPQVPGCQYVYLEDTLSLVDPSMLVYPVKLVPEFAPPASALARAVSSDATGRLQRPPFFCLPELL